MKYYVFFMYLVGCFTTGWFLGTGTVKLVEWIRNRKRKAPDTLVERMQLLACTGDCWDAARIWVSTIKNPSFCTHCVGNGGNNPPDYWDCSKEGASAKRWLEEQEAPE